MSAPVSPSQVAQAPAAAVGDGFTLPEAVGERAEEWKQRIREFHLSGRDPHAEPGAPMKSWTPAVAERLLRTIEPNGFPLHYQASGAPDFRPVREVIEEALEAGAQAGQAFELLASRGEPLAEQIVAAAGLSSDDRLADLLPRAVSALCETLDLGEDERETAEAEGQRLLASLRSPGRLLPFAPAAAPYVYLRLLLGERRRSRTAFVQRVRGLKQRLEGMIRGEEGAADAQTLAQSLGEGADRFLDSEALAHSLRRASGRRPLSGGRRERVVRALDALRDFLAHAADQPLVFLSHADEFPEGLDLKGVEAVGKAVKSVEKVDPYAEALRRFRRTALIWTEAFRAVRVAELELENAYRPEVHGRALARFEWQTAGAEEVEALPAFVVLESAARLADRSLTSWGRLLRSGCPIHALVTRPTTLIGSGSDASGLPDFGFLAMAYREAFVLEAPLAAVSTLTAGLGKMSRSLRPSVAVIAVPAGREQQRSLAVAAHAARVTPSYLYDPSAGESWARKFSIGGNPDPERFWPLLIATVSTGGRESSWEASLTPADAVALDPAARREFLAIPPEAWSDDQLELAEYLERYVEAPPENVPFIWADEGSGLLARAVVTRDMANACHELRRAWRTSQELAGVHNVYVETAVAAERARSSESGDRETARMVDEAKRTGAAEAIYRLVAALADPGGPGAAQRIGAAVPKASTPPPPPAEQPEAQAPPSEAVPEGPYIDSALCTSCNDCINLNPRMFRYNENKQAYLADPKAGDYRTLVKAAAACPAHCIHPGPAPS